MATRKPSSELERLLAVMARLRDPDHGCAWDLEQTFATVAPYTIEEAYEVADAISRGDLDELKDELGDLLLQVVFHARMAEELGRFDFADVAAAIVDKMVRRHPHVFGSENLAGGAPVGHGADKIEWERLKATERASKGRGGVLDGVAIGLPALTRATKLTRRAARVGFDWPEVTQVVEKLHEELAELQVEIENGDRVRTREELGDLLFVVANLARKLDVEPEDALRAANAKFERRFGHVEARLAERGASPEQSTLEEMDALWNEVRAADKQG